MSITDLVIPIYLYEPHFGTGICAGGEIEAFGGVGAKHKIYRFVTVKYYLGYYGGMMPFTGGAELYYIAGGGIAEVGINLCHQTRAIIVIFAVVVKIDNT